MKKKNQQIGLRLSHQNFRVVIHLKEMYWNDWMDFRREQTVLESYDQFVRDLEDKDEKPDPDDIQDADVELDEVWTCLTCHGESVVKELSDEPECCMDAILSWGRSQRYPNPCECAARTEGKHQKVIDLSVAYGNEPILKGQPWFAYFCSYCHRITIGLFWDKWIKWERPRHALMRFDVALTLANDPECIDGVKDLRKGIKNPWKMADDTIESVHTYLKVMERLETVKTGGNFMNPRSNMVRRINSEVNRKRES